MANKHLDTQPDNGWTAEAHIEETADMLHRAVNAAGRRRFKDSKNYLIMAHAVIDQLEEALEDIRRGNPPKSLYWTLSAERLF